MNTVFQGPELHDVERILSDNNLPIDDLSEMDLSHFFGCGDIANPRGIIGLEVYESDGLLRSLSVDSDVQGEGCGSSGGSPLQFDGKRLTGDGVVTDIAAAELKEMVTGYSVVRAVDYAEAVEIAKVCPIFEYPGCSVDIREVPQMGEGCN